MHHHSGSGLWELRIRLVALSDQGKYRCQVVKQEKRIWTGKREQTAAIMFEIVPVQTKNYIQGRLSSPKWMNFRKISEQPLTPPTPPPPPFFWENKLQIFWLRKKIVVSNAKNFATKFLDRKWPPLENSSILEKTGFPYHRLLEKMISPVFTVFAAKCSPLGDCRVMHCNLRIFASFTAHGELLMNCTNC